MAEDVSANKIVVFNVKSFSDSFAFYSNLFKYCNNVLADQVEQTFGVGGRSSNIPFMKRDKSGSVPSC